VPDPSGQEFIQIGTIRAMSALAAIVTPGLSLATP
jgi:hypothetical protein